MSCCWHLAWRCTWSTAGVNNCVQCSRHSLSHLINISNAVHLRFSISAEVTMEGLGQPTTPKCRSIAEDAYGPCQWEGDCTRSPIHHLKQLQNKKLEFLYFFLWNLPIELIPDTTLFIYVQSFTSWRTISTASHYHHLVAFRNQRLGV